MGAFAAEACSSGRYVCDYHGALISLEQVNERYIERLPEYLFDVGDGLYLDAQDSEHFSRFFNHREHGNLNFTVSAAERRVTFYAATDIAEGEELCFDYGVGYWAGHEASPAEGTDSRSFDAAPWRPMGPPPLTPLTSSGIGEAAELPVDEARTALLRTLEYFGARRLASGEIEVPLGLIRAGTAVVQPDTADLPLLRRAAAACITDAAKSNLE